MAGGRESDVRPVARYMPSRPSPRRPVLLRLGKCNNTRRLSIADARALATELLTAADAAEANVYPPPAAAAVPGGA